MSLRLFGSGVLVAFLASMTFVSSAFAAPIYTETFPYADGALIGQGGWAIVGTTTTNPVSIAGGKIPIAATGQDVTNDFAGIITSGSAYLAADINITAANTTGDYFLHFAQQGSTSALIGRIFAKAGTTSGFQFGISTSTIGTGAPPAAAPAVYGGDLAFGTYRIVLRYDIVSGTSNDTVSLYINPISDVEASNTAYIAAVNTGGTDVDPVIGIGQVNIRQGSTTPVGATIDNIVVADDFASASGITAAVPEPSSIALGSLIGIGLISYGVGRRFKR